MKSPILLLLAILVIIFSVPAIVVAQVSSQYGGAAMGMFGVRQIGQPVYGTQTSGMFGNRIIGQPVAPYLGGFATGNQIGPSGSYVYLWQPGSYQVGVLQQAPPPGYNLPNVSWPGSNPPQTSVSIINPNQATTPVNNPPQAPAMVNNLPQSLTPETNLYEAAAPETNPTVPQNSQEVNPPSLPQTNANGLQGVSSAGQGAGLTPAGIGTPAAANFIVPRREVPIVSAATFAARPYNRSPELSDRLTRIARSKGMLSSSGINVYLDNDIALMQGAVRMPGDYFLLANILGLEPGIRQIDNRLIVQGSGAPSSK